jgi:WD40 repeat protein
VSGYVQVWQREGEGYKCAYTYRTHEKEVRCMALTRDGATVVSGAKDGSMHVFLIGQCGTRKPSTAALQPHKVSRFRTQGALALEVRA